MILQKYDLAKYDLDLADYDLALANYDLAETLGYGNYHLITVIAVDGDQMVIDHGRQTMLNIPLDHGDQTIGGKTATTV